MPYIPERIYEDKPDIFTPLIPLDRDNIVEICEQKKNVLIKRTSKSKQYLLYVLVLLFIIYSLKQNKH